MAVKCILKTKTLKRHIWKNITNFGRNIQTLRVDFRTPKSCFPFIFFWFKIHFTRLLFVFHIAKIDKTNPAFLGICVLPTIQDIDLFCQWTIEKTIVIHIVFSNSCIPVNKQTG